MVSGTAERISRCSRCSRRDLSPLHRLNRLTRFSADFCHLSVSVLAVAVTGAGSGVSTRSTLQGQMATDDGIVTKILHTSLDYHSPLLHDVASASQGEGHIQILFD